MTRLFRYLLLVIGVVILVSFVVTVDSREIKTNFIHLNKLLFFTAIFFTLINLLIKSYRWKYILKMLTNTQISLAFAMALVMAGTATSSIAPGRSFEIAKPLMLKLSHNIRFSQSTAAMVIERMLEGLMLVAFFLTSTIFLPRLSLIYNPIIILLILLFLIFLFALFIYPEKCHNLAKLFYMKTPFPQRIKEMTNNFFETFLQSFKTLRKKEAGVALLIFSFLTLGSESFRIYFVFHALRIEISLVLVTFTMTASLLFALATLVPGGVGVTEISQAGLISFFAPYFGKAPSLKSAIILDRILSYYSIVIVGSIILIIFQSAIRYRKREKSLN